MVPADSAILLTLRRGLIGCLQLGLGCLLAALVTLEVFQVFLRYFLSDGIIWGRDVSTLLLFSIAWFGAPLLWLKKGHLAVDLFPSLHSNRRAGQPAINLLMLIAAIIFAIVTHRTMDSFAMIELPALGVAASIKFIPMIIGTGLLILASALNLITPDDQ